MPAKNLIYTPLLDHPVKKYLPATIHRIYTNAAINPDNAVRIIIGSDHGFILTDEVRREERRVIFSAIGKEAPQNVQLMTTYELFEDLKKDWKQKIKQIQNSREELKKERERLSHENRAPSTDAQITKIEKRLQALGRDSATAQDILEYLEDRQVTFHSTERKAWIRDAKPPSYTPTDGQEEELREIISLFALHNRDIQPEAIILCHPDTIILDPYGLNPNNRDFVINPEPDVAAKRSGESLKLEIQLAPRTLPSTFKTRVAHQTLFTEQQQKHVNEHIQAIRSRNAINPDKAEYRGMSLMHELAFSQITQAESPGDVTGSIFAPIASPPPQKNPKEGYTAQDSLRKELSDKIPTSGRNRAMRDLLPTAQQNKDGNDDTGLISNMLEHASSDNAYITPYTPDMLDMPSSRHVLQVGTSMRGTQDSQYALQVGKNTSLRELHRMISATLQHKDIVHARQKSARGESLNNREKAMTELFDADFTLCNNVIEILNSHLHQDTGKRAEKQEHVIQGLAAQCYICQDTNTGSGRFFAKELLRDFEQLRDRIPDNCKSPGESRASGSAIGR